MERNRAPTLSRLGIDAKKLSDKRMMRLLMSFMPATSSAANDGKRAEGTIRLFQALREPLRQTHYHNEGL
jgi:hypothetical protein